MIKIYLLLSLLVLVTTNTLQAQNDSIYLWKAGVLIAKRSIKPADLDSITFKRPFANPLNITTVPIPGGTFVMGSPTTEPNRNIDEVQHTVILSAFHMSTKEITCAQFAQFANANNIESNGLWSAGPYPAEPLLYADSAYGLTYVGTDWVPATGKVNAPMVYVTWYGAASFAQYAGGRLPTESEWEYATRATTSTAFNTGACLSDSQANYSWSAPLTGCSNSGASFPSNTQNVGTYTANAWGLYDMHGNVWEWCSDKFGTYPTTTVTNPTGSTVGSSRILRGGSWSNNAASCRSAVRSYNTPSNANASKGFRVVF